ncbi:MAG: DUF4388 domain-containing protein [Planctomycetota bacterium]
MSFHGDIASISLSDVVQNLTANQKTGTLSIESGGAVRHIQFREGKIVSAADGRGPSILEWLIEKEIVPHSARDEIERRRRRAKRKTLGQVLEDMKLLGLEEYRSYLSGLVLEKLYEILSFREGSFEFLEGAIDEKLGDREVLAQGFAFHATNVLMEAARKADDWQRIRRHIPSEHEIYLSEPSQRQSLAEEAEDEVVRQALALLDGTRTVEQVIAKLPCSRFDACRAIAWLIAEKKVRPMDGDLLAASAAVASDPEKHIQCLKAVLEREPNNREILEKLADATEAAGLRAESATYRKLLAVSQFEEHDLIEAERNLRRSIGLNDKDLSTWQKLWDAVVGGGDREKIAATGRQFFEHFRRLGLLEVARDKILEMVQIFPEDLRLKVDLADVRFGLGDVAVAVQGLFDVAFQLLKMNRFAEAERIFTRILKFDRGNAKAKEYRDKLRSGAIAKRRAARRRFVRSALRFVLFLCLIGYLSYEMYVRSEALAATHSIVADSLLEERRYAVAIERLEAVRRAYPWSITAVYKLPPLLKALRDKK